MINGQKSGKQGDVIVPVRLFDRIQRNRRSLSRDIEIRLWNGLESGMENSSRVM